MSAHGQMSSNPRTAHYRDSRDSDNDDEGGTHREPGMMSALVRSLESNSESSEARVVGRIACYDVGTACDATSLSHAHTNAPATPSKDQTQTCSQKAVAA